MRSGNAERKNVWQSWNANEIKHFFVGTVPRTHACEEPGNKNDLKQQRTTNKLSKLLLQ